MLEDSPTHTLLLQAHPTDDSLSKALFDTAQSRLLERPAGAAALTTLRVYQGDQLTAETLTTADELVVVAPTWWGAMPAILLDQLQRMLGPWVDGREAPDSSPVGKVERLTVITTHGSSLLINRLQGEPGKQLWKRTVLRLCRAEAEFEWLALYGVDRIGQPDIDAFIQQVSDYFDQQAPTTPSASG